MGKLWGKNYKNLEEEIDHVAEALKNFTIIVKWSVKEGSYLATIVEARIAASGESPAEAVKTATRHLNIQFKARKNKKSAIIKTDLSTYNGRILLSTTQKNHKELCANAKAVGLTLNKYLINKAKS